MKRSVVVVGFAVLSGMASAQAETQAATTSTFMVDPSPHARGIDIMRTAPLIAVFSVDPPNPMCEGDGCGPSAGFFVYNPAPGPERTITVECTAFDGRGARVASGSETPTVASSQAGVSLVVFAGADYSRFSKVSCAVAGVDPAP